MTKGTIKREAVGNKGKPTSQYKTEVIAGKVKGEDTPYLCKVLITYTINNKAGVEERKTEDVVFKLTAEGAKMPWYVLRNYLVPRYLTQTVGAKDVAWLRIYEIKIEKMLYAPNPKDITGIPLRIMTYDQLELHCRRWELGVPVREFYSIEKAREMVQLRMEDDTGYRKHLEEYRQGLKRQFPELDKERGKVEVETVGGDTFTRIEREGSEKEEELGEVDESPFSNV